MTATQKAGTPVLPPSLGDNVTEATITRWLTAPGDRIEADEPLLEVATDKVATEIPSPITGTILELVVAEGESVAVEAAIAIIGAEAEAAPAPEMVESTPESIPAAAPTDVANEPAPAVPDAEPVSTAPAVDSAPASATPCPRRRQVLCISATG
jgi:pyruvate/2-oxoglutarate dehydrogenase complex dihydrolipoamide acyltransferase (E2) component